jgi:hypothetical protein
MKADSLTDGCRRRAAADDACDDAEVEATPKVFAITAGGRERELKTTGGAVRPLIEIWRIDVKHSLDIGGRKLEYSA